MNRLTTVALALACCGSSQAADLCFKLYDQRGRLVLSSPTSPVSLAGPLRDALAAARYPNHHLVWGPDEWCAESAPGIPSTSPAAAELLNRWAAPNMLSGTYRAGQSNAGAGSLSGSPSGSMPIGDESTLQPYPETTSAPVSNYPRRPGRPGGAR